MFYVVQGRLSIIHDGGRVRHGVVASSVVSWRGGGEAGLDCAAVVVVFHNGEWCVSDDGTRRANGHGSRRGAAALGPRSPQYDAASATSARAAPPWCCQRATDHPTPLDRSANKISVLWLVLTVPSNKLYIPTLFVTSYSARCIKLSEWIAVLQTTHPTNINNYIYTNVKIYK